MGDTMAVLAKQKSAHRATEPVCHDYTAAVRYTDGRSELFCVRKAESFADAREMVNEHLVDVQSIVIALR